MRGKMITIPADPAVEVLVEAYTEPPNLKALQTVVGGLIEAVPYWATILRPRGLVSCAVYCNEEGKLLELVHNDRATTLWLYALARQNLALDDALNGDVAVLIGDMEFMRRHICGPDPEDWGERIEDWWIWGDFIPMKED